MALKENDTPMTFAVRPKAYLKGRPDHVIDTDLVGINLATSYPAAKAVAAALEAAAVADDINLTMGRKRLDPQFMPELGFERLRCGADATPVVGQEVGPIEVAALHAVDEGARHDRRLIRDARHARQTIPGANEHQTGERHAEEQSHEPRPYQWQSLGKQSSADLSMAIKVAMWSRARCNVIALGSGPGLCHLAQEPRTRPKVDIPL
jgi:hypothetical protein